MTKYAKKKQTMREKKQTIKKFMFSTIFRSSLLGVTALLLVFYIIQTTHNSTNGYTMSELQTKISKLEEENRKLDYKIAVNGSLSKIQERLEEIEMVPVESREIAYVRLPGTAVAVR